MADCNCERCRGFCYIRVPGTTEDFVRCPACGIACSIIEELDRLGALEPGRVQSLACDFEEPDNHDKQVEYGRKPSAEREEMPISDDPSNLIIIEGPEKLFNLYGRDVEDWIAQELNEEQVREWFAMLAAEHASDIIAAMARGEKPYGANSISYSEIHAKIRRRVCADKARFSPNQLRKKAS